MILINLSPKKIYLTVTLVLHLSSNLPLYADDFDLTDVNLSEHRKRYNKLPSAKKADALLQASPQFDEFLNKAQTIAKQYEVEASMGLRLIHSHFTLDENQVMAENYELQNEVPSLVTQPYTLEEAQIKGALPASWIFTDNPGEGGVLFEASSDPAIKSTSLKLQQNSGFFQEIGNALREYKLNHLLSIAILEREKLAAKTNELYMENSYNTTKKSVVQLWNTKKQPLESYVRTSWSFQNPQENGCSCNYVWVCSPIGCFLKGSHQMADKDEGQ